MSEDRDAWDGEIREDYNFPKEIGVRPAELFGTHDAFIGPNGLRAGWGVLFFLSILLVFWVVIADILGELARIPYIQRNMANGGPSTPLSVFLNDGLPFLAVALTTWIMAKIERRSVGVYGLGGVRRLQRFLTGFAWGVFFLSVLVAGLWMGGLLVFDGQLLSGTAIWQRGLIWLFGFLLVGLFEEYAMRGYLQFTLSHGLASVYEALFKTKHGDFLGFWTVALMLSFLFGLGHRDNQGESPIGLLSVGLIGMIFCLSLWRTGSLWWALGFHAAWDWAQSFVFGVADSGTMVAGHLFATHPVGRPLLSGGATGPEGSLLVLPTLGGIVVVLMMIGPKRRDARSVEEEPSRHINSD